jgi:acid phosphatase class B
MAMKIKAGKELFFFTGRTSYEFERLHGPRRALREMSARPVMA